MSTATKEVKQLNESEQLLKKFPNKKPDSKDFELLDKDYNSPEALALLGRGLNQRKIEKLLISFVKLDPTNLKALLNPLRSNQHLNELILSHDHIDDKGMLPIAEFLEGNRNIRLLYLQNNKIGNQGIVTLANALKNHGDLLSLSVIGQGGYGEDAMPLDDNGLKAMASILATNPNLISLNFNWNSQFSESDVAYFISVLEQHTHIQNIGNFRYENNLSLDNLMKIQDTLARNALALQTCYQSIVKELEAFRTIQKTLLILDPTACILGMDTKLMAENSPSNVSLPMLGRNKAFDVAVQRLVQTDFFANDTLEKLGISHGQVISLEANLELTYCRDIDNPTPIMVRIANLEKMLVKLGPKAPQPKDWVAKEVLTLLAFFHWQSAQFHFKQDQNNPKIREHLVSAYTTGVLGLDDAFTQNICKLALSFWMDPKKPLLDKKSYLELVDLLKQEQGMKRYFEWQKLMLAECQRMQLDSSSLTLSKEDLMRVEKYPRLRQIYLEDFPYEDTHEKEIWGNKEELEWFGLGFNQRAKADALVFIDCSMNEQAMVAFANTLRQNTQLRLLNVSIYEESLRYRGIGNDAGIALADALSVHPTVDIILLQGNRLGDATALAFSRMLSRNVSVKRLILKKNQLTDQGISAIVEALMSNHSLEYLNLADNPITEVALLKLAPMLTINQSLAYIDLTVTQMSEEVCNQLLKGLEKNKTLIFLHINCLNPTSAFSDFQKKKEEVLRRNSEFNSFCYAIEKQIKKLQPHKKPKGKKSEAVQRGIDKKTDLEQNVITPKQQLDAIFKECQKLADLGFLPNKVDALRSRAILAYCQHEVFELPKNAPLPMLNDISERVTRATGELVKLSIDLKDKQNALSQCANIHWDLAQNILLQKELTESIALQNALKQHLLCAFIAGIFSKQDPSMQSITELALAYWIDREDLRTDLVTNVIKNLKINKNDQFLILKDQGLKICAQLNLDPKHFVQHILKWDDKEAKASQDTAHQNGLAFSAAALNLQNGQSVASSQVRSLDDEEEVPDNSQNPIAKQTTMVDSSKKP